MIKLTGALCIVLSTTCIGFYRADILKKRTVYLKNIISSLCMLESEISFSQNILRRVFIHIDGMSDTAGLFLKAAERTEGQGIRDAWKSAVDDTAKEMCLKRNDIEVLYLFGENLGMSDRESQIKNIRHTVDMMGPLLDEAEEDYKKNGRLCRGAGILSGLFFAVILY
ncbi:MAG: stage III sporulation protein AB [Oscillospiraceae bacterium]|nr:stage III sporulation protein AB [Oscillospiraceae bacterium]